MFPRLRDDQLGVQETMPSMVAERMEFRLEAWVECRQRKSRLSRFGIIREGQEDVGGGSAQIGVQPFQRP